MRVALPALRADANLYRQYVYEPGDPLPIPIHAYGGTTDPNITREHLARWREQTTREFTLDQFEGGHFYLQYPQTELISKLR
jgi:surfactin synthase thioesterase subunit